jgi:uncharacterized protein
MLTRPVARPRPHALEVLFGKRRVVIGVIHARPLPGAPDYDGQPVEEVYAAALEDGLRYATGGVDGLVVENHRDIPFLKPDAVGPETAATMAVLADRVRREAGLPVASTRWPTAH